MALRGNAFMIMWHDIAPEAEEEYHHWHTREHMPERLSHPGFNRSRRGVNWGYNRQRYFTLYEGDALETFVSDDYMRSLNAPTEWTRRMAPHFRNFLRCACEVAYTSGIWVGGALATFRGLLPEGSDHSAVFAALRLELAKLAEDPRICGVHLGLARPEFSSRVTKETELRPKMSEGDFNFVLIVESFGLRELEQLEDLAPEVEALLFDLGVSELLSQSYDLACALDRDSR